MCAPGAASKGRPTCPSPPGGPQVQAGGQPAFRASAATTAPRSCDSGRPKAVAAALCKPCWAPARPARPRQAGPGEPVPGTAVLVVGAVGAGVGVGVAGVVVVLGVVVGGVGVVVSGGAQGPAGTSEDRSPRSRPRARPRRALASRNRARAPQAGAGPLREEPRLRASAPGRGPWPSGGQPAWAANLSTIRARSTPKGRPSNLAASWRLAATLAWAASKGHSPAG